jgi:uncharacterized cupin superfamily protein
MHTVNLSDVPEQELRSPTGKFHSFCRNLSLAVGGLRNVGPSGGGHPFDLQIRRIPPGAAVCPFHLHFAQWEFFLVRAGAGLVRVGAETHRVTVGDFFVHPPGEPHQLTNTGTTDLEVLIVADNPALDGFYYPDSDKWGLRSPAGYFKISPVDYFDGEDEISPDTATPQSPNPIVQPALPFVHRKKNIDDVPWEIWESPRKTFRSTSKQLSLALGAQPKLPTGKGGHPFDVEYGKLAPGECVNPFHSHAAQWELFFFLSGQASVRAGDETRMLGAGDLVMHPPGEAHQFSNRGDTELFYLLIADNPRSDYWHYPDSKKWGFPAPRMFFRPAEVDYYDGEE